MSKNPLGKPTQYIDQYDASLLFAIAREEKRSELNLPTNSFNGVDIWNAFEISWLDLKGKPQVAIGEFRFDATSLNIVESKSLKLYLNSFNQTKFKNIETVEQLIAQDLSAASQSDVLVKLYSPKKFSSFQVSELAGELIDEEDIEVESYQYEPLLLNDSAGNKKVTEVLKSHLLKSNCLITSQPDWASIQISYSGHKIDRKKLLAYLIAFRSHNEFHEQCVERIFSDLMKYCQPEKLTVYARYTRRGGLDINPWRSNFESSPKNIRLARQ